MVCKDRALVYLNNVVHIAKQKQQGDGDSQAFEDQVQVLPVNDGDSQAELAETLPEIPSLSRPELAETLPEIPSLSRPEVAETLPAIPSLPIQRSEPATGYSPIRFS